MKRKICFVTIAVMVLSLIGCGSKESTDDASAQEEKQNKAKIEEAMENEDYDKAKTLTANDSNYKDLYKDLEAYLMVVNDIQMRYVHAKFDDSEDSEFEECAEKLEGIPNEYKKYSKFKAKIKLYKEELQKAISLEKKFRKKYDKLNDPYRESKVDEYLEIANEWKEEIDKEFPATSEDSYEANLKSYLNDIFLSTLSPYLTATLDSSKLGDGENPYADLQKEQEEREQENTETFTPCKRCHRTYTNGVFTVSVYQWIVGGLSERKYQCRKYYGAYDWRIFYRKNYRSTSGSVLWERTRLSWK